MTFTLSEDGSSLIADRPIGLSGSNSIRRLAIVPAGDYLGASDLYMLTGVNPGLLTLTERTYVEELNYLRTNEEERYNELVNPTLTVEVGDFVPLYERNMGFLFRDYPDVGVDMVERWLLRQFENGELDLSEGGLWHAIFGGMDLEPPAFDRFTIRQWMKGIETDVDKRGLIALATLDYYQFLQEKNPEEYSPGETQMVNSLLNKVNRERAEFANELLQRKQTYENFPVASQMLYLANDNLKVIENRAALAANAFLTDFAHVLGEREQEVLGLLVGSILDGDRGSSIPLLEEWIALRENADPRTIFDDQTLGFLQEMQMFQEQADSAKAAIASGEDYPNPDGFDGLTPYRLEMTPYADFLSETTFEGLEAKLARYDLTANTGGVLGAAAGVGTGYTGVSAAVFAGTLRAAIFPFARGGAHGLLVASAGGAAGAHIAAATAAAAVAVNTVAVIQLVQNGEQEVIFNELVGGETPIQDFSTLDFSPETDTVSEDTPPEDLANHIFKEMLVNSLADMLAGR